MHLARTKPISFAVLIACSSAPAFALSEGDTGSVSDMEAKLSGEQQISVLTAATGTKGNLRGIRFYVNMATKVGYVILADQPVTPNQLRVVLKTTNTDFSGPVLVPQPLPGIKECEQLVVAKRAKSDDCGSLYSTMKSSQEHDQYFWQQGRLSNGNNLITVLNFKKFEGASYEATPNGATVTKLVLGLARYTEDGTRILPTLSKK